MRAVQCSHRRIAGDIRRIEAARGIVVAADQAHPKPAVDSDQLLFHRSRPTPVVRDANW